MLKNLWISDGKWVVNGVPKSCWIGRSSFKLANMLSKYHAGHGQEWLAESERWVEHNQNLLGESVILRVLGETGGWSGHLMFGTEPKDAGIWDLKIIRDCSALGCRIPELTRLNKSVINWLMKTSHETGVAWEYVADGTLKHTSGNGSDGNEWLHTPITDHAIRLTCEYMRELSTTLYPKAIIIVNARNEWDKHNKMRTKVNEVNMWANRMYRWERNVGGVTEHKLKFKEPSGEGWETRQWPEGYIIVDPTVDNGVQVGTEPGTCKMSLEHPDRDRDGWWTIPPTYEQMRADARGAPCGYNESILYGDVEDKDRLRAWYGGGWTADLDHYIDWMENCNRTVDYFIIHDEKGMQCDVNWPRPLTRLEDALGGIAPPPPPQPPTPPAISYRRIVTQAYRDIFGREPDKGGLEHHNKRMQAGLTEAELREGFIRSKEFENRNSGR